MKNLWLISALLFFVGYTTAQNLVHNSNFESSITCPSDTGQIAFASEWFPAGAGADYYDSCCNDCLVDVPLNYMGYQAAYSGHAYAGLYLYKEFIPNYRGYIQGNIDTMIPGHWYRVKIHLNSSSQMQYECISPKIFFYINQAIPSSDLLLPFTPQFQTNMQIGNDTTEWFNQTGIIYADSAYSKLLVGNFNDDEHSLIDHTFFNYPLTPQAHAAYCFIDDISVVDITAAYLAGLETAPLNVSVYPNPFTTYTNISIDAPPHQPYTLALYNLQGQLLRQVNDIKGNNTVLQRDGLPAGFYYYHLNDKSVTVATGKLLIQ